MSMSLARFNQLHSGLSSAAQKVYEVVPIAESWTSKRINVELQRCQINMNPQIVAGCLDTLLRTGLVVEPVRGEFRREKVREAAAKPDPMPAPIIEQHQEETEVKNITPTVTPKAHPKPAPNALDSLGELAQRAAQMAIIIADLQVQVKKLADQIGDSAVELQTQIEAKDEQLKGLKQLQAVLKSLTPVES